MDRGLGSWTARRALLTGGRPAIHDKGRTYTYQEWHARCCQLAHWLRANGVRPGDRVAVLQMNGHQFLEIMFASAKLNALFVPINVRLAPPEIAYILADAGVSLLFAHDEFAVAVQAAVQDARMRIIACGSGLTGEGSEPYEALLAGQSPQNLDFDIADDDPQMLMYTSGTTGRPKGAMLTHGNTLWNAIQNNMMLLAAHERYLVVAPMFHIGGINVLTTPGLYVGACIHLLPAFEPRRVLQTIERGRITSMFAVPSMWQAIIQEHRSGTYDLASLRFLITGGAPCPVPVLDYFHALGIAFLEGFGLTETAPFVSLLGIEDCRRKHGSIGLPAMHVEMRIVDDQDGDVPRGAVGELLCRGPNIFKGYWNDPDASRQALRGGWFHTGDLAREDQDGFYYLVDRKKDMLISGGENVYPAEVEQVIYRHPSVAEVAVIGVTHPQWQEVPRAIVVARPETPLAPNDIIAFCAGQLAQFKIPKSVILVDALPRSGTGKVLKTVLRERYGAA